MTLGSVTLMSVTLRPVTLTHVEGVRDGEADDAGREVRSADDREDGSEEDNAVSYKLESDGEPPTVERRN